MSGFEQLRKEYESQGLQRKSLDPSPFIQFQVWFDLAVQHCPGPWFEPNAMTLATCGTARQPTARTVLLKHLDDRSFYFFTCYDSDKAQQIAENQSVGLLFHWPYLGRQVRIDGTAAKSSRQISDEYFHSRPRAAQIAASISTQSSVAASREEIDQRFATRSAQLGDQVVPLPDHWGGYTVTPQRFEFWQGRRDRLHDRFRYDLLHLRWQIERLYP